MRTRRPTGNRTTDVPKRRGEAAGFSTSGSGPRKPSAEPGLGHRRPSDNFPPVRSGFGFLHHLLRSELALIGNGPLADARLAGRAPQQPAVPLRPDPRHAQRHHPQLDAARPGPRHPPPLPGRHGGSRPSGRRRPRPRRLPRPPKRRPRRALGRPRPPRPPRRGDPHPRQQAPRSPLPSPLARPVLRFRGPRPRRRPRGRARPCRVDPADDRPRRPRGRPDGPRALRGHLPARVQESAPCRPRNTLTGRRS